MPKKDVKIWVKKSKNPYIEERHKDTHRLGVYIDCVLLLIVTRIFIFLLTNSCNVTKQGGRKYVTTTMQTHDGRVRYPGNQLL